jgi:hypothetical protein
MASKKNYMVIQHAWSLTIGMKTNSKCNDVPVREINRASRSVIHSTCRYWSEITDYYVRYCLKSLAIKTVA